MMEDVDSQILDDVRTLNTQVDVLLTPESQKARSLNSLEEEEAKLVAMRQEMLQVKLARDELQKRDDTIKSLRLQVSYLQGVQSDLELKLNNARAMLSDHESVKADALSYREAAENMTTQSERMREEFTGLVNAFEAEKAALVGEVDSMSARLEKAQRLEAVACKEKRETDKLLIKSERAYRVLEAEAQQLRDALEESTAASGGLQSDNTNLSERAALATAELEVMRAEVDEKNMEVWQWRKMNGDLDKVLSSLRKQTSNMQETHAKDYRKMQERLEKTMDAALGLRNENQDMFTVLEEMLADFANVPLGSSSTDTATEGGAMDEMKRMQALRMLCQKVDARAALLKASKKRIGSGAGSQHWQLLARVVSQMQALTRENFRCNSRLGEMRAALSEATSTTEQALGTHRRQESKLHILRSELDTADRLTRNVSVQLAQALKDLNVRHVPELPVAASNAQPSERRGVMLAYLCSIASAVIQHSNDLNAKVRKLEAALARSAKDMQRRRVGDGSPIRASPQKGQQGPPHRQPERALEGSWTSPRKSQQELSFSFEKL